LFLFLFLFLKGMRIMISIAWIDLHGSTVTGAPKPRAAAVCWSHQLTTANREGARDFAAQLRENDQFAHVATFIGADLAEAKKRVEAAHAAERQAV
jgi:hypothetical protein